MTTEHNIMEMLFDGLCRAAFAPQPTMLPGGIGPSGVPQYELAYHESPLLTTVARMLEREIEKNERLRAAVVAELCKPENIKVLVGELAKGIGRMRVDERGWPSHGTHVVVPDWIKDALSAGLQEWLGTDEANDLIPQMLERSEITVNVVRKEAGT